MASKGTGKRNSLANVKIVGEGFDDLGHRYIKLKVKGSDRDLAPYSIADLTTQPDKLYKDLGDAGCSLFTPAAQRGLLEFLQDYKQQKPGFSVVTRLGSFQRFYVLPDKIIGNPARHVECALGSLDADMLNKYRCRGSLELWQKKIGQLCVGNSRLMFAASLACTGPILSFVSGPRSGGFQISGRPETGKTAAAMIAGSIWGCHRDRIKKEKGFAESWNTTTNKLEKTAQAHSDAILILDETNLAGETEKERAIVVLSGAFRLSEGTQKERYNERDALASRGHFLSTSNHTLDELADLAGVPIGDQHRGRLADVCLPTGRGTFGIYENLHGFSDGAELTDAIKKRCRTIFGTPGYKLVCTIYKDKRSRLAAKHFIAKRRNRYIEIVRKKAVASGVRPLERATARFATVYAAGCLAIKYGILPWSRQELLKAVLRCQLDGPIAATKTTGTTDPRARLLDYLVQNRRRFVSLNRIKLSKGEHKLGAAPGYLQTHKGEDWIYLTSGQLQAVVGRAAARLKKDLIKVGMMAATGERALVQRPIFKGKGNKGYRWVHAFRAALLANSMVSPRRRALNRNK
jgi:putative DNA primase/helicase